MGRSKYNKPPPKRGGGRRGVDTESLLLLQALAAAAAAQRSAPAAQRSTAAPVKGRPTARRGCIGGSNYTMMPTGPALPADGGFKPTADMKRAVEERIAALNYHYEVVLYDDDTLPEMPPPAPLSELRDMEREWRKEHGLPALECPMLASEAPDNEKMRTVPEVLPPLSPEQLARYRQQPAGGVDAETDVVFERIRAMTAGPESGGEKPDRSDEFFDHLKCMFYGVDYASELPPLSPAASRFVMMQFLATNTMGQYTAWLFFPSTPSIPFVCVGFPTPHHDPFIAAYRTAARTHDRDDALLVYRMIMQRGMSYTSKPGQKMNPVSIDPLEIALQLKFELRFPGSLITGPQPGVLYVPNEDAMMQLHLQQKLQAVYVFRSIPGKADDDREGTHKCEIYASLEFGDQKTARVMHEHFKGALLTGNPRHVLALLNVGSMGFIRAEGKRSQRFSVARHTLAQQLLREFGIDLPIPDPSKRSDEAPRDTKVEVVDASDVDSEDIPAAAPPAADGGDDGDMPPLEYATLD